jgi:murein DD-endopeptidase MepM/ murein hydrolase activator NlpD
MRRSQQRGAVLPVVAAAFAAGVIAGWWLRSGAPMPVVSNQAAPLTAPAGRILDRPTDSPGREPAIPLHGDKAADSDVAATTGEPLVAPAPLTSRPIAGAIDELRGRELRIPIDNASVDRMKGGFDEGRPGHAHEAVDILAPRNTPIHAVDDGAIAKLFQSKAGGTTIYQYDPSGRYVYYYAHLESYAPGLREGQRVSRGDVVGYVGTSGNAPPNTPHLHFAVFELDADRRWWKGRAIDPYLVFRPEP